MRFKFNKYLYYFLGFLCFAIASYSTYHISNRYTTLACFIFFLVMGSFLLKQYRKLNNLEKGRPANYDPLSKYGSFLRYGIMGSILIIMWLIAHLIPS